MINLPIKLKRILFVAILLLLGVLSNNLHAQEIKLKVSKDSTIVNGIKSYSITLKILQGSLPFNIAIFKDKPGKSESLIQSFESYNSLELKVENISIKGIYYIAVSSTKDGTGKLLHISI